MIKLDWISALDTKLALTINLKLTLLCNLFIQKIIFLNFHKIFGPHIQLISSVIKSFEFKNLTMI